MGSIRLRTDRRIGRPHPAGALTGLQPRREANRLSFCRPYGEVVGWRDRRACRNILGPYGDRGFGDFCTDGGRRTHSFSRWNDPSLESSSRGRGPCRLGTKAGAANAGGEPQPDAFRERRTRRAPHRSKGALRSLIKIVCAEARTSPIRLFPFRPFDAERGEAWMLSRASPSPSVLRAHASVPPAYMSVVGAPWMAEHWTTSTTSRKYAGTCLSCL